MSRRAICCLLPLLLLATTWMVLPHAALAERGGRHGGTSVGSVPVYTGSGPVYYSPYLWAPSYSPAYTYGTLVAPGYPSVGMTIPAYTWYYGPVYPSPYSW